MKSFYQIGLEEGTRQATRVKVISSNIVGTKVRLGVGPCCQIETMAMTINLLR